MKKKNTVLKNIVWRRKKQFGKIQVGQIQFENIQFRKKKQLGTKHFGNIEFGIGSYDVAKKMKNLSG